MAVRLRPRRSVLAAGTVLAGTLTIAGLAPVSGCSLAGSDEPDALTPPDADALRSVAGEALDLADRYEQAIAQVPDQSARLTAIRDAHREHAAAISRSLDRSVAPVAPSASASAVASGVLKALQAAERAAAERAAAACVAVAGHHAPLIGTIAAARASFAEALT